jgi:hypothetical protein
MGRRQVTSTITMFVLIGILVVGAVWGWRALFAAFPETELTVEEPTPTCKTERVEAGERIRARQVRVSVFNAGTRSGLAGETMDALINRGFQAGDVSNAPSEAKVRRVQVWSTSRKDPRARLVARQFGPRVKVRVTEEPLGSGVTVIVGNNFKRLAKAPRSLRVAKPQEVCVPVLPTEPVG